LVHAHIDDDGARHMASPRARAEDASSGGRADHARRGARPRVAPACELRRTQAGRAGPLQRV